MASARASFRAPLSLAYVTFLVGGCSTAPPEPPPPDGIVTVAAISYGQVTRASVPTPGVTVRAWAHKDQCREPRGDGDIALTEADGRYRRLIQVVGSPGQGCVTFRFYFDRGGATDSVVKSGLVVPFRAYGAGASLDSIQIDAVLPP